MVWALPRSLAATEGILSFPRGTEMFQFPRFPSCLHRMTGYHTSRVAPFGHPWIASCQRFPRAFRRVATSFFGNQRQGIHRVPFIPACTRFAHRASFPPGTPRLLPGDFLFHFLRMGWFPRLFSCQGAVGGAAGARTPNLRRARAALSQLSYDPNTVGAPGLEPGTSALSGPRSNQLSYAPADHAVPHTGGHPPTMEKPLYNSDVRSRDKVRGLPRLQAFLPLARLILR